MNNKVLPFMCIAHRGASGQRPENTLAAFQRALEMGCSMIECDVRLTKDRELVVVHDRQVDRTTDAEGYVSDFTLAQLKQMDAGAWFDPKWRGETIPTLEETLDLVKPSIRSLVIELKDGLYFPESVEMVLAMVESKGMKEQVDISSFNMEVLKRVKEIDPEFRTSALVRFSDNSEEKYRTVDKGLVKLYSSIDELVEDALAMGIETVCPPANYITQEMVDRLHQHGFVVRAWGWKVLNKPEMEQLIRFGIDGTTTDYPDQTMEILKKLQRSYV